VFTFLLIKGIFSGNCQISALFCACLLLVLAKTIDPYDTLEIG